MLFRTATCRTAWASLGSSQAERLQPLFAAESEERIFSHLAWSPDGQRLAFTQYLGRFDIRDASLLVADVASGRTRTVLSPPALHQQSYTAAFTWTSNASPMR